jgi:hypothetical protein
MIDQRCCLQRKIQEAGVLLFAHYFFSSDRWSAPKNRNRAGYSRLFRYEANVGPAIPVGNLRESGARLSFRLGRADSALDRLENLGETQFCLGDLAAPPRFVSGTVNQDESGHRSEPGSVPPETKLTRSQK